MFEKIKKIIISTCSIIFVLIAALILLFLFGYRTEVSYISPVWSKDGSRIYYVKSVGYVKSAPFPYFGSGPGTYIFKTKSYIMSMKPDGSNKRVITKFIRHVKKNPPLVTLEDLAILPLGKELIFYLWTNIDKLRIDKESGIYKINTDGTNLTQIVNFRILRCPAFYFSFGREIAYTKYKSYEKSWPDRWSSSWLVDTNGQNNYIICGEQSKVEGWTKDGKVLIEAYVDPDGNVKPMYDDHGNPITYEYELKNQYLLYDPLSKKLIKEVPQEFDKIEAMLKKDANISPDGKKRLFVSDWISIGIEDINGKNSKILLKGKQ